MRKKIAILLLLALNFFAYSTYSKEDLYNMMLSTSPTLKQSQLDTKASHDIYKSYEGALYPRIGYSLSAAYIANPLSPINISYSQIPVPAIPSSSNVGIPSTSSYQSSPDSYINLYPGMENTAYSAGITVIQPLNVFGKILNIIDMSKEIYHSKSYNTNIQKNRDKNMLFCSYDIISCIDKMESELAKADKEADELIQLSDSSYNTGMITYSKNTEATTAAYRIKSAYQNILSQKSNNFENIKTLTGNYELSEHDVDHNDIDMSTYLAVLDADRSEYVKMATAIDKDVINLRRSVEKIADDSRKLSIGNMFYSPDIYLFASLSFNSSRFPFVQTDWYGKGDWQGYIGLSISGNAFDGFSQFRSKEAAENNVRAESEATRATIRTIEENVNKLLNNMKTCAAEIRYKEAQKREKELIALEVATKFQEGSSSKIDYLSAQIQSAVSSAELHNEYIKLIAYYYALMTLVE